MGKGRRTKLSDWLARGENVVLIGVPLVVLASLLYQPWAHDGPVICLFRRVTGAPCPGCGMTRSFCALGHGQWRAALGYHPLGPALYAVMLATWLGAVLKRLGRDGLYFALNRLTLPILIAMLAVWVYTLAVFFSRGDGLAVMARENAVSQLLGWMF